MENSPPETMEQFIPNIRDRGVQLAFKRLLFFSIMIITLPLGSMFLLKRHIFEGVMGYSSSDAILYAAIVAVVIVHVILAMFVYVAWNEDVGPAHVEKPVEKQD